MKLALPVALTLATLLGTAAYADPPAGGAGADASSNSVASRSSGPTTQPAPSATPSAAPAHPKGGFQSIDIPAPPDGKGEVVFFRKSGLQGSAVWFKVRENGAELGKLTSGVYFVSVEDPGAHTFTAATENKDTLKLEVDPGETYYVEGRVTMGMFIGEANLSPSDEATFQKNANHLKAATPVATASAKP